ncbi:MAG TPA: two-component regulator propeller domain-containing protein [Candidatus Limnocylindrales bacterium]|jgi:ligand-binding sensor domain-containing protein|nr:two-component regulator propeller domain-containing protein [Candidatus Limnocylindrales bacterium]
MRANRAFSLAPLQRREVLECASPLALSRNSAAFKSVRGLAQSKTLSCGALGLLFAVAMLKPFPAAAEAPLPFPLIERFENFGVKEGMPTHKVHCVLTASDGRLWVGTYKGAVVREDGKFRRIGVEDGLTHPMVMCMVEDTRTGEMWIGTMRGLNCYSAGRITTYTQTGSGLPNNVVYGVDIVGETLWVATAAGLGALNLKTGGWSIYDHNNTVMHEPWVYSVKGAKDRLFVGVWGGGILEYEFSKGIFKEHRDPDRDFHFDLVPDDGPVNDITSWIAWEDGVLWQGTYFGMSRYDGLRWHTWQEKKSPLLSNFVNFIWAHGRVAWIGTDRGVSVTDGNDWVNCFTNEKGEGVIQLVRAAKPIETRKMSSHLPNDFVLGIWVSDREAWFATSDGLGHGIFATRPKTIARVLEKNDKD